MRWKFFLATALAVVIYLLTPVYSPKVVYVPKGSTFTTIASLNEEGINVHWVDAFFLRMIGHPQQGWIKIKKGKLTRLEFLYRLTKGKGATREVMIIPGETSEMIMRQLAQELDLDEEKLREAYTRHARWSEGNLVPNTYAIPNEINEDSLIVYLLHKSSVSMRSWSESLTGEYDEAKWLQIVTKASVIQKEAASNEDMPMVSSVIDNRIAKKMRLQMDGSLNYGPYSHQKVTAERIRNDHSTYNTYKHRGLPTAPVCNVSKNAIVAAINPAKTDYLFFVRGKNGEHVYTSYFSTHKENIQNATK